MLPDGSAGEYHYVHTPGPPFVIPVRDDGSIVLVKQFRYLLKKESLEFVCGGVKNNDFDKTAKDELAEEAMLAASNWKQIGEFDPFNGATDELCRIYLATGLSAATKERDASEEFEIVQMNVSDLRRQSRKELYGTG